MQNAIIMKQCYCVKAYCAIVLVKGPCIPESNEVKVPSIMQ